MNWNFGVSEIAVLREVAKQEKTSSVKAEGGNSKPSHENN